MTSKEIWNYLVDHHNKNTSTSEEKIQQDWEAFFSDSELFSYSKIRGEVDSHRSLQIGSYERIIPDIILRKNNTDLFVVELKKYSLPFSKDRESQLFSYLKLLHIPIGILICNKIYVYYYDFNTIEQKNSLEITFEKDSIVGINFIELFCKESFEKEKILNFINKRKTSIENINNIKNELNNQLIYNILKNHFASKYSLEEIETALKDYNFICEQNQITTPKKDFLTNNAIPQNDNKKLNIGTTNAEKDNLIFWTKFNNYISKNTNFLKEFNIKKPTIKHWYTILSNTNNYYINITHLTDNIGIEIYIPNNKSLYKKFFNHKAEIESFIGAPLEWKELPAKKASRIFLRTSIITSINDTQHIQEFDWIINYSLKFKKAFFQFYQ